MSDSTLKEAWKEYLRKELVAAPFEHRAFTAGYKAALPQWIKASEVPQEWKDGKDRLVYVDECRSIAYWGKTAHVPLYGWMDPTTWNGDGCDLMDPQPDFVCLLPSGPVE